MKCERILSAKIDISKKAKQQRKYNKELYDTHCLYLAELFEAGSVGMLQTCTA